LLEEIVIIKIRPFRIPNPAICFRAFTDFHISTVMYRTVVGSLSITASRNLQNLSRLAEKTYNDFTVPQSHNFNILKMIFLIVWGQIYKDLKTTDSQTFNSIKMLCMFVCPWDSIT